MRRLRAALWRLLGSFNRARRDRQLGEELESHLQLHIADNIRLGMSPAEARRVALVKLGGMEVTKELCRDRRGFSILESVAQDARDAVRLLRRSPGFATVVVLSLALGIGANTVMFSILNSLVLRSLPVQAPEQLALVTQGEETAWSYPIWEQLEHHQHLFAGVLAWSPSSLREVRGGHTESVPGMSVSRDFFDVLGVRAILGRTFAAGDDGLPAVISEGYWKRRFGGSTDAIGQSITLDHVTFTIIGVTPRAFYGLEVGRTFDVALLFDAEPLLYGQESKLQNRSTWWLNMLIRRKPGQSMAQATVALRAIQPHIRGATLPHDLRPEDLDEYLREPWTLTSAGNGISSLRQRYQRPLVTIMVVAGLVLLVACANIATLQLARANVRRHELSLRLALGASRLRIARQLLTESLLLSVCGALLGLACAQWGTQFLVRQLSTRTSTIVLDTSIDWRVLAFAGTIAILTALLFGIAPALRTSRLEPGHALKEQGRGLVGEGRMSVGNLLVVVQVALSLTLLVGAGLFLRTFVKLTHQDLGFDRDRVLVASVRRAEAIPVEERTAAYEQLREAAAAVPGVASATSSLATPISGISAQLRIEILDARSMQGPRAVTFANFIGPHFFETYGTKLIAGRGFTNRDDASAQPVATVNETFVRSFMKGRNPLGRMVREVGRPGHPGATRVIVGYVENAAYRNLRQIVPPTLYVPIAQRDDLWPSVGISIRAASGSPALLARPLSAALTKARPDLLITLQPLAEQVSDSLIEERLVATLSGSFGALALLLAGIGLYGITSYAVSRRRTELAVRMAIGAAPAGIVRMVLGRVAGLVLLGVAAGGAITLWAARLVETLLYGVEPNDPLTLAGAALLLALVGAIGGWLPALRASRIDPATTLQKG